MLGRIKIEQGETIDLAGMISSDVLELEYRAMQSRQRAVRSGNTELRDRWSAVASRSRKEQGRRYVEQHRAELQRFGLA